MKYFYKVAIFCLLLMWTLTSCSYVNAVRMEVAERGAVAEDQILESARWAMCNKSSIGAILREYDTPDKLEMYLSSCGVFYEIHEPTL
jgi:hypothetical protein